MRPPCRAPLRRPARWTGQPEAAATTAVDPVTTMSVARSTAILALILLMHPLLVDMNRSHPPFRPVPDREDQVREPIDLGIGEDAVLVGRDGANRGLGWSARCAARAAQPARTGLGLGGPAEPAGDAAGGDQHPAAGSWPARRPGRAGAVQPSTMARTHGSARGGTTGWNSCGVGANPRAWSGLKPSWPVRTRRDQQTSQTGVSP